MKKNKENNELLSSDKWKKDLYKKGIELTKQGKIRVLPRTPEMIYQNFEPVDHCNGDFKKAA